MKFHSPSQTSGFFHNIWIARNYPHVNTGTFKAHSTRSASTSKAGLQGASIEDILKQGSWSNKTTWQRFYNKNIVEEGKILQEMVFKPA